MGTVVNLADHIFQLSDLPVGSRLKADKNSPYEVVLGPWDYKPNFIHTTFGNEDNRVDTFRCNGRVKLVSPGHYQWIGYL